jgi:outer membrane lipoprotein
MAAARAGFGEPAFKASQSRYDGVVVPGGSAAGGETMLAAVFKRPRFWLGGLPALAVLGLAACASQVPAPIRTAPPAAPSLTEVRGDIDRFVGQAVRWGGTVAAVENRAQETFVEIVARELGSDGRPVDGDSSEGRFLARVGVFLDPAVYTEGRQVTVSGVVEGTMTRPIGDFAYRYPVVRTEMVYLWEPLPERPPYYYDPWWLYDPWYPYPWRYRPYYPYNHW